MLECWKEKACNLSALILTSRLQQAFHHTGEVLFFTRVSRWEIVLEKVQSSEAQWLIWWSNLDNTPLPNSSRNHLAHCVSCTCHMNKCVHLCVSVSAHTPVGQMADRLDVPLFTLIYHLFTNSITDWLTARLTDCCNDQFNWPNLWIAF